MVFVFVRSRIRNKSIASPRIDVKRYFTCGPDTTVTVLLEYRCVYTCLRTDANHLISSDPKIFTALSVCIHSATRQLPDVRALHSKLFPNPPEMISSRGR